MLSAVIPVSYTHLDVYKRQALTLDTLSIGAFCERLIALGLAEDQGYGHLRFDPALIHYLGSQLDLNSRAVWRERWRTGMEQLLAVLYPQSFKDSTRAHRLLRLELPNLLALLRDTPRHVDPERIARLANQLAVSYTHLDVYKRQLPHPSLFHVCSLAPYSRQSTKSQRQ